MWRLRKYKHHRYTARARLVLSLAQEETERRKAYFIEPEYVLIGFLREEGGVARLVLDTFGLTVDSVQSMIDKLTTPPPPKKEAWIDLAPETKDLLRKAVHESRLLGHNYVGTEHLLLGLMRLQGCTAQKVMAHYGLTYKQVRERTLKVILEWHASNPPKQPSSVQSLPPSTILSTKPENIETHNAFHQDYPTPLSRFLTLFREKSDKNHEA